MRRCSAQLDSGKTLATVDKVNMRIVKAGDHAVPMKIDHPRRGAGEAKDLSRGPNLKDAIALDGMASASGWAGFSVQI